VSSLPFYAYQKVFGILELKETELPELTDLNLVALCLEAGGPL